MKQGGMFNYIFLLVSFLAFRDQLDACKITINKGGSFTWYSLKSGDYPHSKPNFP